LICVNKTSKHSIITPFRQPIQLIFSRQVADNLPLLLQSKWQVSLSVRIVVAWSAAGYPLEKAE